MEFSVGSIVGGKYQLERPLARGGMGALWIAKHTGLDARHVLKLLYPQLAATSSFRLRFEREAKASAALRSPHIVRVHDYGIDQQIPFIAMELLEGEDLRSRVLRVGRLSIGETWKILVQVGRGLRRAHEAGIIHRDLKPANLFLARSDGDEVVKIVDFGIAKVASPVGDVTQAGEMVGSPHYMSPEQVRCERDIDQRSDLWSLGVILFRMLTGVLPFPGAQFGPVIARVLVEPIPIASKLAPDLPVEVDTFFARALARERGDRFSDVTELVEAFALVVARVAGEGTPLAASLVSAMRPSLATMPELGSARSTPPAPEASMIMPVFPALDDHTSLPTMDADADISLPIGAGRRALPAAFWVAAAIALVVISALVGVLAGGSSSSSRASAAALSSAAASESAPVAAPGEPPPSPASPTVVASAQPSLAPLASAGAGAPSSTVPTSAPAVSASAKPAADGKVPGRSTRPTGGKRKWF